MSGYFQKCVETHAHSRRDVGAFDALFQQRDKLRPLLQRENERPEQGCAVQSVQDLLNAAFQHALEGLTPLPVFQYKEATQRLEVSLFAQCIDQHVADDGVGFDRKQPQQRSGRSRQAAKLLNAGDALIERAEHDLLWQRA